jgi:transposase
MTIMADAHVPITGGVDTHRDVHVAAALDARGGKLGVRSFPTTPAGHQDLLVWLGAFGPVERVGVEGTGAWGAGLTRHLLAAGLAVIEVDRPNRQHRRRAGKSDPTDAVAAARAAQSGEAAGLAKDRTGAVEAIRTLRVARRSAQAARRQAVNQLHSLVTTAPVELREQLRNLNGRALVTRTARFRPGIAGDPLNAAKVTMRALARRVGSLEAEVAELDRLLVPLVATLAPGLVALHAVGTETAGALLVSAGENASRLHSEAAFAHLCGVAPIEASSGQVVRRRLNRGGDRQANSALWRIVLIRMHTDERTKAYVERRLREGKSKREIMRSLKRYVAREVWRQLPRVELVGFEPRA